jgi:N-alpha-acetyltransferase 30
MIFSQDIPII